MDFFPYRDHDFLQYFKVKKHDFSIFPWFFFVFLQKYLKCLNCLNCVYLENPYRGFRGNLIYGFFSIQWPDPSEALPMDPLPPGASVPEHREAG